MTADDKLKAAIEAAISRKKHPNSELTHFLRDLASDRELTRAIARISNPGKLQTEEMILIGLYRLLRDKSPVQTDGLAVFINCHHSFNI